mmetsp:Transcript_19711/g.66685  ORF Transcript_19711/g.66685 Transcript_19711/m.66685 type:complete len:260 (-) Transcript_19711:542-1321(-)
MMAPIRSRTSASFCVAFIRKSRLQIILFEASASAMSSTSLLTNWLHETSRDWSGDAPSLRMTASDAAESDPSELAERLRLVMVELLPMPSRSMRPPSSTRRLSRRLRWLSESLSRIARPRYRPPSACIWLSASERFVSTLSGPSSFASSRTPWFVILLCEKSRCVICVFLMSPVMSMRSRSSSMRFDWSTSVVRFSASTKHLARQLASEIFMPKRSRSYFMPIFFTPYVKSSLVRLGSEWIKTSRSGCARSCRIVSVKT